jgi:hypothetical protein
MFRICDEQTISLFGSAVVQIPRGAAPVCLHQFNRFLVFSRCNTSIVVPSPVVPSAIFPNAVLFAIVYFHPLTEAAQQAQSEQRNKYHHNERILPPFLLPDLRNRKQNA